MEAEEREDGTHHTVENELPPQTDGRNALLTGRGVVSTGRGLVHLPLHDGTANHVDCTQLETDKHPRHRFDRVSDSLKEGVDAIGDDGDSDNDGERVEVVHDVVGRTVEPHTCRHGILHRADTSVGKHKDRNEEKDLASFDGLLDLVDKLVVPEDFGRVEVPVPLVHDAGFGSVPERVRAVTLEQEFPVAALEAFAEDVAGLEEDGTLRRRLVESLPAPEEDERGDGVEDSGLEEGEPESNESLRIGRGQTKQRTNVDAPVELIIILGGVL